MQRLTRSRFQLIAAYLIYGILAAGSAQIFYQNTFHGELVALREQGAVRLSEASSRLRLQIDGYRALTNVVADNPQIVRALSERQFLRATAVLKNFEATYGAWRIDLTTPDGVLLTSSASNLPSPTYSRSFLRAAANNRLGFRQAIEAEERVIRLSRGVLVEGAQPQGIVVLTVSLAALEFEWPVAPEPIVFFDADQVAFSSNRLNLLLLSLDEDPEQAEHVLTESAMSRGLQLWRFQPPDGVAGEIIKTEEYVPQLELTGVIFLDTSNARATARLRVILVIAGAVVLGLIGTVALQQRRRRMMEEQYSSQLEARVEARTEELRGAQGALIEASKLAALGRLSAGVSHELNQPLAAILNFSENGRKLLARGNPDPAAQNLTQISDQVHRINRIIGNLRTFARQEAAPTEVVDFQSVISSALEMARDDIVKAKVGLDARLPEGPLWVLAGQVRLEQVVLNLISNALDAMTGAKHKDLRLVLGCVGEVAHFTVTDSGHGIANPTSVFEPFYTTKDLGSSKGLGMGLALSHGIITRFGGTLSCRNLTRGAEFKITLPIAEARHA
jgi:two-component system C4-dicarboxylate transport sensor histidine kinase DctB